PQGYRTKTLPFVATLTFKITCVPDVNHLRKIIESPYLPELFAAITKVQFTGFHWFSGIAHNRTSNPNLLLCNILPHLQELTINFHTAGMTISAWSERDRIRMENEGNLRRSKQLKVLRMADVVRKYDLNRIFRCRNISLVRLICWDSAIVRYHSQNGDP
ncbi:hypothetical protein K505DRAFT_209536, partial [Melanomma pulvis-pyrius CBS 109.77]